MIDRHDPDAHYARSLRRYIDLMPRSWQKRWNPGGELTQPEVLSILEDVINQTILGQMDTVTAGAILRPLTSHPLSEQWPDGELVAIGLHADLLAQYSPGSMPSDERAYEWSEILFCSNRVFERLQQP